MSTNPWQFTTINPQVGTVMKEPVQLPKILKTLKRPLIVVGAIADQIGVYHGTTLFNLKIT